MSEPSHADIIASVEVLKTKALVTERDLADVKAELRGLRKDLRTILVSEAETRGTWSGVKLGARLTLYMIAATAGAGAIKTFEWAKELIR